MPAVDLSVRRRFCCRMIYLGGHWLTDVLVGWFLGGAVAFAVMRVRLPRTRARTA